MLRLGKIHEVFDDAELERIRRAARQAEESTSGEVVAYLVSRVDDYDDAAWKGAALGALAAAAVLGLVHSLGGFWGGTAVLGLTLPTFAGAAAGYLLTVASPTLERCLIPEARSSNPAPAARGRRGSRRANAPPRAPP